MTSANILLINGFPAIELSVYVEELSIVNRMMELVYDRNSLRTYYCLFLSVILVSVATEN